jgi:predicted Fe-Mo cluster-binding NifX family protein
MNSVRIGVGTSDGVSVCDHLARSAAFVIMAVEDGRVVSTTVRHRATDQCGNHATFTELLEGCHAIICGGIGQGAADSLVQHGILPIVIAGSLNVDDAVSQYLAGKLATTNERVCLCH